MYWILRVISALEVFTLSCSTIPHLLTCKLNIIVIGFGQWLFREWNVLLCRRRNDASWCECQTCIITVLMLLVLLSLSVSAGIMVTHLHLHKELDVVRNRLVTGALFRSYYVFCASTAGAFWSVWAVGGNWGRGSGVLEGHTELRLHLPHWLDWMAWSRRWNLEDLDFGSVDLKTKETAYSCITDNARYFKYFIRLRNVIGKVELGTQSNTSRTPVNCVVHLVVHWIKNTVDDEQFCIPVMMQNRINLCC